MKTYQIGLTDKGLNIFKGGNIEVMKEWLIKFNAENEKEANARLEKLLTEKIGRSNEPYLKLFEVSK